MYSLISVLIPVYNAQRFLHETLQSVQSQTFLDWECVCVNDGSSDGSQEILEEMIREDSRFRGLLQSNRGLCRARNRALDSMRGDAFLHADADDLLTPFALESMAMGAETSGAKLIVGKVLRFTDEFPQPMPVAGGTLCVGETWRKTLYQAIVNPFNEDLPIATWAKLYDRKIFGDFRLPDFGYADDVCYTPQTHLAVSCAFLLNAVTYLYRVGHVSASNGTCSVTWVESFSKGFAAAARLSSDKDYVRCWTGKIRWFGHTVFNGWVATGELIRNPVAQKILREGVARLLDSPIPMQPKWRLRFLCLRFGLWRTARLLFGAPVAKR